MRVISLLIQYSITAAIILLVSGVLGREILLFWAGQQVKGAVNLMEQVKPSARLNNEKSAFYDQQCQLKGGKDSGIGYLQLRFLDNRSYVVEVVCSYFGHDPILVKEYTLPPLVQKFPGSAGLILREGVLSAFTLEMYGRKMTVSLNDEVMTRKQGVIQEEITQSPLSICSGYGYQCCDAVTETGEGNQESAALDCPQTCYAMCTPRPTVLRLTSDPNPDIQLRQVQLSTGNPITFYYVVDPGVATNYTVTLDTGDGNVQTFNTTEGDYTHEYQCQDKCEYKAVVKVVDEYGTESVETSISSIKVLVN